jgi:hypothetical protein
MDLGKLLQQFDHPVVVFQGVQTYPGQAVLTCDQILVIGLMLVPENNDAKNRHRRRDS